MIRQLSADSVRSTNTELQGEDNRPETDPYEVRLDVFEGPLDLLLFLIRKDELDIYDIPIAHITAQFLRILEQLHTLNLEQSSEFILMAATLMRIKSQMILPRDEAVDPTGEEEDPREELVRRLLEYQQFKEVAEWLGVQRQAQRDVYLHRHGWSDDSGEVGTLQPVSLFDLLRVYQHILETVPENLVHRIVDEEVSIEECIDHLLAVLDRRSRVRFYDLIEGRSKEALVGTFVGMLELLKSQRIQVQQAGPFDEIWIEQRAAEERTEKSPGADKRTDPSAGVETTVLFPGLESAPSDSVQE